MGVTPGFNKRIGIRFTADKRGKPIAHYWSDRQGRWFRMPLEEAKLLIATEQADRITDVANHISSLYKRSK